MGLRVPRIERFIRVRLFPSRLPKPSSQNQVRGQSKRADNLKQRLTLSPAASQNA
jgi:hypothetical protein